MSSTDLQKTIEAAFDDRANVGPHTKGAIRDAVETALDLLDKGEARVAEKIADASHVREVLARQSMAEESGPAVFSSERHGPDCRRARRRNVVG